MGILEKIKEYLLRHPVQYKSDEFVCEDKNEKTNDTNSGSETPIPKTLGDLFLTGDTYWRFSQSSKEIHSSDESLFLKYKEDSIVEAKDPDKGLSFVPSEYIGTCCSYGDQITQIIVDPENPLFQKIKNEPISFFPSSLGEIEARKLCVGKNFSLEDTETINMIIGMSNPKSVRCFLIGVMESETEKLKRMGFTESAEYLEYIKSNYNYSLEEDIEKIKNELPKIHEEFRKYQEFKYHRNHEEKESDIQIRLERNEHVFEKNFEDDWER